MWTHSDYIEFFKGIASTNVNILHTETESHFCRIIPVDNPYAGLNIEQYINDKRSKLHLPCLMLQMPQTTLKDPGDAIVASDELSFIIIDKPESQTFADEDGVITKTALIANGIVGYLRKYFKQLQPCPGNKTMRMDGLMIDTIQDKPFWGTKVSFRIVSGANDAFRYNDADWVE